MATTTIPNPNWLLLTVSAPGSSDVQYMALAPGCTNTPHNNARCGCQMFTNQADGDRYIRSVIR